MENEQCQKRLANLRLDFNIRNISDFVEHLETVLTDSDDGPNISNSQSYELQEIKREEGLKKLQYLKKKRNTLQRDLDNRIQNVSNPDQKVPDFHTLSSWQSTKKSCRKMTSSVFDKNQLKLENSI